MLTDEQRVKLFKLWKGIDVKVGDYFPDENLESLDTLMQILDEKCLKYQLEKGDEKYYWAILYIPSKDGFERVLGHEKSLVEAIQKALLKIVEQNNVNE
jgi:hypothetical protein